MNNASVGLKVAVTRPRSGTGEDPLSSLLRQRGAWPVHRPLTRILPPEDVEPLLQAAERIEAYDWLIMTSARAVAPFVDALERAGFSTGDVRRAGIRVCAVGPRTGDALDAVGLPPAVVPERFEAEGLLEALLDGAPLEGVRVLFPRAEEGRETIPRGLVAAGAHLDVVPVYRTEPAGEEADRLVEMVLAGELDVLTFTAASGARSFADAWIRVDVALPTEIGVVVIGPATADALEDSGIPVSRVADPHTLEGLVSAVEAWADHRA